MASVLSVDAEEFIPGTGIVGSKPKLGSSLSVDAPVFVPVIISENRKEKAFSSATGNQENKSVQRRGRFIQSDSRVHSNQKNVEVFGKIASLTNKEINSEKNVKLPSAGVNPGIKNVVPLKERDEKKKLKQSFSLEYSKCRKHGTTSRDLDGDIHINKSQQHLTSNSGESKPIILWSSIVKQDPNKAAMCEDYIHQKISVKPNILTDENPVPSKKYSKNKVTRTKNVLSEPPPQRTRSEWKRKDINDEDIFTGIKPISVEFPKFISGTNEVLNNKSEKKLLAEVCDSNVTTHKPSPVIKNTKRSKGVKSAVNIDLDKNSHNNFNCEAEYSKNYIKNEPDISNPKSERRNETTVKVKKSLDVKNKLNNFEKCLNGGNKALNNNQLLKLSKNSNNTNATGENKPENIKSLNISDNSTFPALAKRNIPSIIPPLSYSAVARKIIPMNTNPAIYKEKENVLNIHLPEEEEKKILRKKQKALNRRLKVKQKKQEAKMDKSTQESMEKTPEKELTLDLSDMFTKLLKMPYVEKKSQRLVKSKKVKMSTGVISVVSGLAKKNTPDGRRVERNKYGSTHTIMDGITPILKRGKERETPKKKRPTLLKKVITAERERKRAMLEKPQSSGVDIIEELALPVENNTENELHTIEKVEYISEFPEDIWKKIHSKKFREYCDHVLTKEINQLTYTLLVNLQKFQDRVYHENHMKYKQKRRFILGLREVLKHLKLKRLKAVIIAPNIERISSKGGLDDYLGSIISICNEQEIPKVFAMNRHVLGRVIKKLAPVSVVGIFDYDGAHDIFKELVNHVQLAKVAYMEKVNELHGKNDVSSQKIANNVCMDSIENDEQIGQNNGADKLRQQILSNLYVDVYRSYDAESESDAWVTDTESAPL